MNRKPRLNLALDVELRQKTERLAQKIGASNLTETIRRALELYDIISEETKIKNSTLWIKDKEGNFTKILIS